jgi:hypothetical protein
MSKIWKRMEEQFWEFRWNPPAKNKIYLENDFSAVWSDLGWSTKRYGDLFDQVPKDLQKVIDAKGAHIN